MPEIRKRTVIRAGALRCCVCDAPMDWTKERRVKVEKKIAEHVDVGAPGEPRFAVTCPVDSDIEDAERLAKKTLWDEGVFE